MALFKSALLFSAAILLAFMVCPSKARRTSLFNHLAIRNSHPEDHVAYTPSSRSAGNAEVSVGMEQTAPELLPTSERQTSNEMLTFGTDLNDFLRELERYVAIAGRPRFGRSTDTQTNQDNAAANKSLEPKTADAAKEPATISSLPELHITIKLCHGNKVCIFSSIHQNKINQ